MMSRSAWSATHHVRRWRRSGHEDVLREETFFIDHAMLGFELSWSIDIQRMVVLLI